MDPTFVIIDSLTVVISIFSIYVTFSIYQKYRLNRTIAFIIASINILLWNLSHVFYDVMSENDLDIVRVVWYIAAIAGALIMVSTIHGFSSLRNEGLTYSLIIYYVTIGIFLTAQLVRKDWYDLKYDPDLETWGSDPKSPFLWYGYISVLFIMLIRELFYPLFQAYSNASKQNRRMILILLISAILAMASNLLLPILDAFGLPQVIKNLVANIGLLTIFIVLYRHPFLGFHDPVDIHQIIIANTDGIPIYSTSDVVDASLASGALFGISTILDEIGTKAGIEAHEASETTRKIELATNRFFIITLFKTVIIYHYGRHTGVCISKFTSLARLFREAEYEPEDLIGQFQTSFVEYFPELQKLIFPASIISTV